MDQELRKLNRLAAAGDADALYRLLIRLFSIGDFELADLNPKVRTSMALELLKTFPGEADRARIYSESDPTFVPGHNKTMQCPTPGCAGSPEDFTYHYLAWQNFDCEPTMLDDVPVIAALSQSGNETVLDTILYCPECESSWRIDNIEWI